MERVEILKILLRRPPVETAPTTGGDASRTDDGGRTAEFEMKSCKQKYSTGAAEVSEDSLTERDVESGVDTNHHACCPICLESLVDTNHCGTASASTSEKATTITGHSCAHVFHYDCLWEWMNNSTSQGDNCPICRQPLWDELLYQRLASGQYSVPPSPITSASVTSPPNCVLQPGDGRMNVRTTATFGYIRPPPVDTIATTTTREEPRGWRFYLYYLTNGTLLLIASACFSCGAARKSRMMSVDNGTADEQPMESNPKAMRAQVLGILFPRPAESSATAGDEQQQQQAVTATANGNDEESQRHHVSTADNDNCDDNCDDDQQARTCAICLDAVVQGGGVSGGSCQHYFHYDCLFEWMMTSDDGSNNCCPTCRQPLYDTDLYNEHRARLFPNSQAGLDTADNAVPTITLQLPNSTQRSMSQWAQTSLACGLFSLFSPLAGVLAVVLAILALVKIQRNQENGTGLAIAGMLVGAVGFLWRVGLWAVVL